MVNCYEDMNDNVNSQNGAWMTSWLSDHTEKLRLSIPDNDKDTEKFEDDCTVRFWDNRATKFVEKLFVYISYKNNFSLEVICHADKLRWYASYFDMKIWPRSRHPIENWKSLFR